MSLTYSFSCSRCGVSGSVTFEKAVRLASFGSLIQACEEAHDTATSACSTPERRLTIERVVPECICIGSHIPNAEGCPSSATDSPAPPSQSEVTDSSSSSQGHDQKGAGDE